MELLSRLLPAGSPLHLETWHLDEAAAQLGLIQNTCKNRAHQYHTLQ